MRRPLAVLALLLALSACSRAEPTPPSLPTSAATAAKQPASVPVSTDLPPAPPLEQWVNRTEPQQALDLQMRTHLIQLGVKPADLTDAAARDLAYLVCATLRAGVSPSRAAGLVQTTYPTVSNISAVAIVVTAQGYCLDTVAT